MKLMTYKRRSKMRVLRISWLRGAWIGLCLSCCFISSEIIANGGAIPVTGFNQVTSNLFYDLPAFNVMSPATLGTVTVTPSPAWYNGEFAIFFTPETGPSVPGDRGGVSDSYDGVPGYQPMTLSFSRPVAAFGATLVHLLDAPGYENPVTITVYSGLGGTGQVLGAVTDSPGAATPTQASANFVGVWSDATNIRSAVIDSSWAPAGGYAVDGYAIGLMPMTHTYPKVVVADHPAAYWRLDDGNGLGAGQAGAGAIAHDLVGGYHGTYTTNTQIGAMGYNPFEPDTAAGFGVLPGGKSYVSCDSWPDPSLQGSNAAFTVEAWVRGNRQTTDNGIVTVGYGGATQFDLLASSPFNNPSPFRFSVRDAATNQYQISAGSGLDGTWHHIVGVCDRTDAKVKLYVDGTLAGATTIPAGSGLLPATTPLSIGARRSGATAATPDLQFVGSIDEVAIYTYALSATQVSNHYAAGAVTILPRAQTAPASTSATFALSGAPPGQSLSCQWRLDGANVAGATASTLNLSNLQPVNAGNYDLVLSNSFGSVTTAPVNLSVVAPLTNGPGIVSPPAGLVNWWAAEGNAVDLVGGVSGNPMNGLSFRAGKVGQAFRFDGAWARIKLSATNLPPPWTASLWVFRQNAVGASAAMLADGISALKLEQYPGTRQVGITAFVTNYQVGDYTFGYIAPVATWTHLVFVGTATNTTLYTNGIRQSSLPVTIPLPRGFIGVDLDGNFDPMSGRLDEIMLFNRALSSAEIASLYATGNAGQYAGPVSPVITVQPLPQTVAAGTSVAMGVSAVGTPIIQYQWQFQGSNISGATSPTLLLTNVPVTAAGLYRCLASNIFGSALSSNATLTVTREPSRFATLTRKTGGIQFELLGLAGAGPVVLYASTNLVTWEPILTNPPVVGTLVILDAHAANFARRFYRFAENTVSP